MSRAFGALFLPFGLALVACSSPGTTTTTNQTTKTAKEPVKKMEPEYIEVDHILIAFNGAPRMNGVTRSLAEAKELTDTLVARIHDDGDWAALKRQFSDDPGPTGNGGGPYAMANTGAPQKKGVHPRSGMVPAFGDVGFVLEVDEVGVAEYDAAKSPYGYHIIKRVK
jgi:hypothetical protein